MVIIQDYVLVGKKSLDLYTSERDGYEKFKKASLVERKRYDRTMCLSWENNVLRIT